MQLSEFLGVLRTRWQVIAGCVVVAVIAAVVVTVLTPPVYTASARIYLSAENADSGSGQGVVVLTSDDLDTYVSILDTQAVLDPLREELGMSSGQPVDVDAQVTGSTSILNITARSSDPDEAAAVANEVGPQLAAVAGEFTTLLAASGQEVVSTPIQPAEPPAAPTSPNPVQNVGLALLAGLMLGLGLALTRDALDTRVRSEEHVKALSDAPMLAGLPLDRRAPREHLLSIESEPHSRHAEAVRRLRTNLMFVDVTRGKHSFVVTSAVPGEGKTTTAANLGMAMADAGTRTLLVDADLRNPCVATTLGIEGSVGLTTVLLGQAEPSDVIQRWGRTDLHVLPAGTIPPNPSELLGSEPMESLLGRLVEDYDFVLIDSPPVVSVIDAVIIERLTGGLLMVVGVDRTKKKDLSNALKQLQTVGATVAGFARNFVPPKEGPQYQYGYGRVEETAAHEGGGEQKVAQEARGEREEPDASRV